MYIIFALAVILFGVALIFLVIPRIRERDKIKQQEKIWDEFDESDIYKPL